MPRLSLLTTTALLLLVLPHSPHAGDSESIAIEHSIAAMAPDRFHGWPANNGVWQWGDEIVVGFTQGDFELRRGHNIAGRELSLLSRSTDGGRTWTMFDPDRYLDSEHQRFTGDGKQPLDRPIDFAHPDFALRIFGTGYHGVDDPAGGFLYSLDRGKTWRGPFSLTGLTDHPEMRDQVLTPRTDYIVRSSDECLVFISAHRASPDRKRLACIRTADGGRTFEFVAWITPEFENAKSIMCQTVQLSDESFVTAFRKMTDGADTTDTIEAYGSLDGCRTWTHLSTVKVMRTHSNPPALVRLHDGRLCCVYGDRHTAEIRARYSNDQGQTWGPEFIVRDDFRAMDTDPDSETSLNADMGYPRLVQRSDGRLVAMYYWATAEHPQQHIAVSIWTP